MSKKFGHWIVNNTTIDWDKSKPGPYSIPISQLLHIVDGYYDWLIHVPQKTWMDSSDTYDLNDAFQYACEMHDFVIDEDVYDRTVVLQDGLIRDKNN